MQLHDGVLNPITKVWVSVADPGDWEPPQIWVARFVLDTKSKPAVVVDFLKPIYV